MRGHHQTFSKSAVVGDDAFARSGGRVSVIILYKYCLVTACHAAAYRVIHCARTHLHYRVRVGAAVLV